jgi:hypothetical protein
MCAALFTVYSTPFCAPAVPAATAPAVPAAPSVPAVIIWLCFHWLIWICFHWLRLCFHLLSTSISITRLGHNCLHQQCRRLGHDAHGLQRRGHIITIMIPPTATTMIRIIAALVLAASASFTSPLPAHAYVECLPSILIRCLEYFVSHTVDHVSAPVNHLILVVRRVSFCLGTNCPWRELTFLHAFAAAC